MPTKKRVVEDGHNFYIFNWIKGACGECIDWFWSIYDSKYSPEKKRGNFSNFRNICNYSNYVVHNALLQKLLDLLGQPVILRIYLYFMM